MSRGTYLTAKELQDPITKKYLENLYKSLTERSAGRDKIRDLPVVKELLAEQSKTSEVYADKTLS